MSWFCLSCGLVFLFLLIWKDLRYHHVMTISNEVGVVLKRNVGFNSMYRSVCSDRLLEKRKSNWFGLKFDMLWFSFKINLVGLF